MKIKDFRDARHLAARLEIGIDDEKCRERVGQHVVDVLDSMIPVGEIQLPLPVLTDWEKIAPFHSFPLEMRHEVNFQARLEGRHLTAWWLEQICKTKYPLQERMTIFWHNHFTTDANKVVWPQFIYRQNKLLRKHALGNFADLLHGIVCDSAMLKYLDVTENIKQSPNENFARELLELFTLGEGEYSESDVVEAARAFTGYGVDFEAGDFSFNPEYHDEGVKFFLGRRGNFNGEDIINIILQESRTAEHIAEKFWKEFINHEKPDPIVINYWASVFRDSGYDIKSLLKVVVHSQDFWSDQNYASMIKSPVEFSIGMLREFKLDLQNFNILRKAHQQLGQDLLYPPDVKGWRGGSEWVTNTRLIRRYDLVPKLLSEHNGDMSNILEEKILKPEVILSSKFRVVFDKIVKRLSCSTNSSDLIRWLLAIEPVFEPNCDQSLTDMLGILLKDPAYQLK